MLAKPKLLEKKILAVSEKRRITIPKSFYKTLNFGDKVECFARGNELVLRPVSVGREDFSDLINADIAAGNVTEDFGRIKADIASSLGAMIDDAKKAAHNQGEYSTFEEIFGGD